MKISTDIILLLLSVAVCQTHITPVGNHERILKLESKVSVLSNLIDQLRDKTTRYLGCYKDDIHRLMKDSWVENGHMTHSWCINHCRKGNHKYAGLEWHSHCLCGNQMNTTKYPKMPEGHCNSRCKGNTNQMCGGVWRLSIWKLQ